MPFEQRSLMHREAWIPLYFVRQNQPKKIYFFVWRFQTTSKHKCSNRRPLLSITFPQGFRISRNIGHPTLGSWGKKTFKQYLESEHTNRRTDTQTDISTYRKHRPRGPMIWKSFVTFHVCLFRCHMSPVTCHLALDHHCMQLQLLWKSKEFQWWDCWWIGDW